jgi:hypothetical protein
MAQSTTSINTVTGNVHDGARITQIYAPGQNPLESERFLKRANIKPFTPEWLLFYQDNVELVGREKELELLTDFLNDDREVLWWAIVGPGGVGKSRLAHTFLSLNSDVWDGGFLASDRVTAGAAAGWQPKRSTIWVIDYAAKYCGSHSRSNTLEDFIAAFYRFQGSSNIKTRVILLDRNASDANGWYGQLIHSESRLSPLIRHLSYSRPLELSPLREKAVDLLSAFIRAGGRDPSDFKIDKSTGVQEAVSKASDFGRPLFLALLASAIINEGLSIKQMLARPSKALLRSYLLRELRIWRDRAKQDVLFDSVCYAAFACTLAQKMPYRRSFEPVVVRFPDDQVLVIEGPDGLQLPTVGELPGLGLDHVQKENNEIIDSLSDVIQYPDGGACLNVLSLCGITESTYWALRPDVLGETLIEFMALNPFGSGLDAELLPAHNPERIGRCIYWAHRVNVVGLYETLSRLPDKVIQACLRHEALLGVTPRHLLITLKYVARTRSGAVSVDFAELLSQEVLRSRYDPHLLKAILATKKLIEYFSSPQSPDSHDETIAIFATSCNDLRTSGFMQWVVPFVLDILSVSKDCYLFTMITYLTTVELPTTNSRAREIVIFIEAIERAARVAIEKLTSGAHFEPSFVDQLIVKSQLIVDLLNVDRAIDKDDIREIAQLGVDTTPTLSFLILGALTHMGIFQGAEEAHALVEQGRKCGEKLGLTIEDSEAAFLCERNAIAAQSMIPSAAQRASQIRTELISQLASNPALNQKTLALIQDGVRASIRQCELSHIKSILNIAGQIGTWTQGQRKDLTNLQRDLGYVCQRLLSESREGDYLELVKSFAVLLEAVGFAGDQFDGLWDLVELGYMFALNRRDLQFACRLAATLENLYYSSESEIMKTVICRQLSKLLAGEAMISPNYLPQIARALRVISFVVRKCEGDNLDRLMTLADLTLPQRTTIGGVQFVHLLVPNADGQVLIFFDTCVNQKLEGDLMEAIDRSDWRLAIKSEQVPTFDPSVLLKIQKIINSQLPGQPEPIGNLSQLLF